MRNYTDEEFENTLQSIVDKTTSTIFYAAKRAFDSLTEDEKGRSGGVYAIARMLVVLTAGDAIEKEWNAEAYKEMLPRLKRILRKRKHAGYL